MIHSPPPSVAASPPPAPATLFARGTCYLGGQAVAIRSHSDDPTQQSVRVVVTFDRWDAGAVFTVLVNGRLLRSTNSWSADEVASGTPLSADFAFAFELREAAPQAENAFAFRLEGQRFDRLVKLSCEAPQAEPPPQHASCFASPVGPPTMSGSVASKHLASPSVSESQAMSVHWPNAPSVTTQMLQPSNHDVHPSSTQLS